ncbi:MAG: hypothetical protein Hens2KO_27750 [Henriciella sp.]
MPFDQDDLFASERKDGSSLNLPRCSEVEIDGVRLETTPVFDAYWYFAFERQNMFRRRHIGSNAQQSSEDWILASHRFTNAYRASDRVSQHLIRYVIWADGETWSDEDHFFRTLIFKLFNRIDTWNALKQEVGSIRLKNYDFETFDRVLTSRQNKGIRNYSAAYIMPSAGRIFGYKSKHANHLRLVEWMLDQDYPTRLQEADNMQSAYNLLVDAPSIGPFLAYQFVTDLNYGPLTNFSEMEFVVAGPGALDGISKCFLDSERVAPERIIHHMAEKQAAYFKHYGFEFFDLWGRPLQLIDCQNIFCEISKYSRAAYPEIAGKSGRSRIKQKYKTGGQLNAPWYPPDWGLNERIEAEIPSI